MVLVSSSHSKLIPVNPAGGMQNVPVLDAKQRSALAMIRSLGRHDLHVVASERGGHPLGAASKYAASGRATLSGEPRARPFSEIMALADRLAIDTIISATDLTTMLLVSQPDLSKFSRPAAPTMASYEHLDP